MVWSNWNGTVHADPRTVERPTTTDELVEAVRSAISNGRRCVAVGGGHSYNRIAAADDVQIDLSAGAGIRVVDGDRVTIGAGTVISDLNAALDDIGLAVPVLGDIDRQSVAGAIATGTHGSGRNVTGLAAMVRSLDIVDGHGDVRHLDASDGDDFLAARVSLGALGLIDSLELDCVDAFELDALEAPCLVDDVIDAFGDLVGLNDHLVVWWVPNTRWCLVRSHQRGGREPFAPLPPSGERIEDIAMAGLAGSGLWEPDGDRPTPRRFRDRSHRVFCNPEVFGVHEMEYAVPADVALGAFAAFRAEVERHPEWRVRLAIELRFTAADNNLLSPGHGRDTTWIAVHELVDRDHSWFGEVEPIWRAVGGRPHWGKLHTLSAPDLAPLYRTWERFAAVRRRFDPDRVFANDERQRLLGE